MDRPAGAPPALPPAREGQRSASATAEDGGRRELVDDPLARSLALARPVAEPLVAGPAMVASPSAVPAPTATLEVLLERLVRRIGWGSDGRRSSARLELGAGVLAGLSAVVHVQDGEVSVELELPPGVDADRWQSRLLARFAERGLVVGEISVRSRR